MDTPDKQPGRRHFLEGKTVFVAGAGVAGLGFVAGLRKLWDPQWEAPTIVIFDRDPADEALRRESERYSLSLSCHSQSGGLIALQKLGLVDDAMAASVSGLDGSGSLRLWAPDWSERARPSRKPLHGLPTPSVRISRRSLRRVLGSAVEGWDCCSIEWDSQCLHVAPQPDGRLAVRVERARGPAGRQVEERLCHLVVAADGASSKLRRLMRPGDGLQYTGAVLRGGLSRFETGLPEPPGMNWGFVAGGGGVSCFVSPVDKHTLIWAVGSDEADAVPEPDRGRADEVEAVISRGRQLGLAAGISEPFEAMVSRTEPRSVLCVSARDKLPFRHDGDGLESVPVVFIGDSNHAMSPFAGFGANLALADAWDLAEQVCGATSLAAAVEAYDDVSEPRARAIIESSRAMMRARLRRARPSCILCMAVWLRGWASRMVAWASRG